MNSYYVYILANWNNRVLYVGMTGNLERRVYEHKNKLIDGFTSRYNVNKLVYYEEGSCVTDVIAREKQLKGLTRAKKNRLVEAVNPMWRDLSEGWYVR